MTFDFSPLYRTAIGFDRLARLLDAQPDVGSSAYPPYNIERVGEDKYRLTMAVAGFREQDIDLTVKENTLFVSGRLTNDNSRGEVLHRGIGARAFERRFVLADHMVVEGATLENGLLHVAISRVIPEALKPRKIEIQTAAPSKLASITSDAPAENVGQDAEVTAKAA